MAQERIPNTTSNGSGTNNSTTPTYLAPPTTHHTHHQQQIVYPATNQVTLHHSENNSNVSTRSPSPVPPPSHSINYQNSNIKANNMITNANTNNDNATQRPRAIVPAPTSSNPTASNNANNQTATNVPITNVTTLPSSQEQQLTQQQSINSNEQTSVFVPYVVRGAQPTPITPRTNIPFLESSTHNKPKKRQSSRSPPPVIKNPIKKSKKNRDNDNIKIEVEPNNNNNIKLEVDVKMEEDVINNNGRTMVDSSSISESTFNDIIVDSKEIATNTDMIEQLISNRVRKLSIQEYDEDNDKKDSSTSSVDNKKLSSIKVEGKQKDKVKETTATKKRDKKDNSKSSFSPTEPSPTKSSPLKSSSDSKKISSTSEKKNGKITTITSAKVNNNKITNIINGNKNKATNTPDSDTDLAMDDESEEEEIEQVLVVDKKMKQSQQSRNNKQPLHVIRNLATGESGRGGWNSDDMETENEEEIEIVTNTTNTTTTTISTTYNANNSNNNNGLSKLRTTSTISNNSKDDDNFLIKSEESPSSLTNNNNGCVATSSRKSSSSSSRKGSTSSTESNKDTASSTTTIASITNTVSSASSSGNRNTSISSLSSTVTTNGRARPSPTRRKSTIRENDERLELAAIEWEKNIEIPHHIWEETLRIFEIVKHSKEMKNRQPHRKRNHILASILFILCRRNGLPRTFVEICQAASIRKQEIGTYYRLMQKVFESNGLGGGNHGVPRTVDSSEYLKRWCQNLKLPDHILNAAIHVYRQASELNITTGKCPVSVGAASIWLSISSWNESRTIWNTTDDQEVIKCEHKDVASAAGVVNATLVGCFKNLSKFKEQLLPSGFIEEAKKRSPFPNRMSVWLPPNNSPNKNHAVINNNGSNSSADGGINNGNANGVNNYNVNNNNTVVTYTTSPTRIHNNDDDLPMNVVESQDDELEDGELRESEEKCAYTTTTDTSDNTVVPLSNTLVNKEKNKEMEGEEDEDTNAFGPSALTIFSSRSCIFGNSLAWMSTNNVDLLAWWKSNFGAVAPELTKIVVRVLSILTSSDVTNVGEDIDDSDDDDNNDGDDNDGNVDSADNSDIDSDDENESSVNI
ncbi:14711_t:CDS:10 [Entrophospora sp. SA101]|nr:14711_t:CDS:10 [Entrophospora sp. SA101]